MVSFTHLKMKTLVFSDTHFTTKFDKKRFVRLKDLIEACDHVVINGDLFEGMTTSFTEFVNSRWNELFPLLKAKNAVYVYGNHDDKALSDARVLTFCDKAVDEYTLDTKTQTYHFKHGQEFLFPKYSEKRHLADLQKAGGFYMKAHIALATFIQKTLFTFFGPKILPNSFNHIPQEVRAKIGNPNHLLVCGHTHRPHYDKTCNFMDIGFFNYGWANYLLIDDEGKFEFKSERY